MGHVEQWVIYTVLEKLYVPVVCCFTDRHFACRGYSTMDVRCTAACRKTLSFCV